MSGSAQCVPQTTSAVRRVLAPGSSVDRHTETPRARREKCATSVNERQAVVRQRAGRCGPLDSIRETAPSKPRHDHVVSHFLEVSLVGHTLRREQSQE